MIRPGLRVVVSVLSLVFAGACGGSDLPTDADPFVPVDTMPRLEGTWTRGPDLPVGLYQPGVVAREGMLYVLGGARRVYGSDEGTTGDLFVLDTRAEGGWAPGPTYPVDGMNVGLFFRGDTLYGIGGLAFPGKQWDRFFRLAPGADAWERLPLGAEPRGELRTASVGGRVLAVEYTLPSRVWAYDPDTTAWTPLGTPPLPRNDTAPVALDGRLFVVYGQDPAAATLSAPFIDAYDPSTGTWTRPTFAPASRRQPGVAVSDGRIHVVGGVGADFEETATHHVYDPGRDVWYTAPDLPEPRGALVGAAVDGRLWFLGGGRPGNPPSLRTEVWIFTPAG